jgi:hypothetical protein
MAAVTVCRSLRGWLGETAIQRAYAVPGALC